MLRRIIADEGDLSAGADGDLAHWRSVAAGVRGPVLEIGCGAGRILTALGIDKRQLIGLDLDREALSLAGERAPMATWICADGRDWRSVGTRAELVIVGGDLISVIPSADDLAAILRTAAVHLAPHGRVGIDATLMDPQLFSREVNGEWAIDLDRPDAIFTRVRRESRIFPDPEGRPNTVLLEIRHRTLDADGVFVPLYPDRAPFAIRAWQPDEVREIAVAAGLRLLSAGPDDRLRWLLRSADE